MVQEVLALVRRTRWVADECGRKSVNGESRAKPKEVAETRMETEGMTLPGLLKVVR